MLTIAAVLFAIAALGGITLATLHFRHKGSRRRENTNKTGDAISRFPVLPPTTATIAALGGFALLSFHLRRLRLPTPVVLIHALVAVVAFVLLLVRIAK